MAHVLTHTIALPPYALALFIVVVLSLFACTAAWVLLVHRRRNHLRIPTTQVEAQVQVQVQVEKIHDATPARSASWLGLPFASSTTPSPSDTWIQRILRRHSKEAANVVPPDAPATEKHAPTHPPLGDSQPPRIVKKEMWLAFDSDATLATLHNDPLRERCSKASHRVPASTSAMSTPSLVDDKSSPPSPVSFWEPPTPPPVLEEHMTGAPPSHGVESPAQGIFKNDEETADACLRPRSAHEETQLSFPSASSSVCTLLHDTPSSPTSDGLFAPEPGMDCEMDLVDIKRSCKRLAALIDAISVSFSVSTLGPPFSKRNTKLALGHYDSDDDSDDDSSDGDSSDSPHCDNDDGEWDLGTTSLHESYSQREYSVLAI